ncbi:bifunctional UDP-N-acetylglucosamine diphosphorylase/glucosamine-1-phosphate N-acetyltransferase GlmU [Nesterenkonia sphaerica]|uniref:Bifunctional protein GlmU n=1 Tax=Nesterenkonia sphaerica TaxID=1804988 RepID=A0A5R9ADW9_9MICC|nr:bifunctional UDP-N-acetylglucosamine diphosphorylase/glucosamine-1-phosphate N-acetyltransferase GlmU [Nesterenkonia sphaerica]TLP76823.1 bifunctional UDP-N-acetylglucosamine diphosphorylase/glucosamine-1-phosphate N-acetyltransferase GlmU [Nesterenkonia sphaerica]
MPDTAARPTAVIVLAAGAGTRMKSRTPKILHPLGGRSMIGHALAAARALEPEHLVAVVRHQREKVAEHITEMDPDVVLADQDEIPGTGRAVECGLQALTARGIGADSGTVVVTYGDVPLLTPELLRELVAEHQSTASAVTVLTTELEDPTGYGRVLRSGEEVIGIVEQKDADEAQRQVREINSGIYAFDAAALTQALREVSTDNAQGEKYLTDVLSIARASGRRVSALVTQDRWQVEGANDRVQLQALGAELNRRTVVAAMRAGTTVIDPATTWIDATVTLEEDTTVLPGTQLHGSTHIARDAVVGPDSTLRDVTVGEAAEVTRTHATGAAIGAGSAVGPFSYLRPGTVLGEDGKIGAFYETKNVTVGRGSKLSHLGYAGDTTIGEYTNIGCGNITANYDGEQKHRTVIGSHVRTSSNTVFIAPVEIGDGAYTAAGAVVRKPVPPGALAVSVAPQRNAEGWVKAKRPGSAAARAADAAQAAETPHHTTNDDAPTATD